MSTLYNSGVTKEHVYKVQLHCHTTNSDGVDSSSAVMTAYKKAGFDAATNGNMIAHGDLGTSKPITTGDTARFPASSLTITFA